MKSFFLIMITIFGTNLGYSQEQIPGLLPRFYANDPATDLNISRDRAHAMAQRGDDLSLIEPVSNTNIFNPNKNTIPSTQLLQFENQVTFVGELPSRSGQFRFTVKDSSGNEFIIVLSQKNHNTLLRRNILAKIGYKTHPMNWKPRISLNFENVIDKAIFEEEMQDRLLASSDRWVTDQSDNHVDLQDVLVMQSYSEIYNLALGVMASRVHRDRRLLRAPYIPLALVDIQESVNLTSWSAGRLVLDHVKLNHSNELSTDFSPSWGDARWIGRRLAKLDRQDFSEIVEAAYFPNGVKQLVLEKIISRRNDMLKLLKLETQYSSLAYNSHLTIAPSLIDGEIVQEFFPGYSTRFSYGDPETPFSSGELGSFAISKVQSQLIAQGMMQFNTLLSSNNQTNYVDALKNAYAKDFYAESIRSVIIPTYRGGVILSRDIVAGTYLGTDNKIQLVDSFGYEVAIGAMGGLEGLPIPITFRGGTELSYRRVFSHIKPLQSIKRATREPYRNMIVPFLVKGVAESIGEMSKSDELEDPAKALKALKKLKDFIKLGESLIITESLEPSINMKLTFNPVSAESSPFKSVQLAAFFQKKRLLVNRMHIHRSGENTFHIYKDVASGLKLNVSIKLKAAIPILKFSANWSKSRAKTKFYKLELYSGEELIPNLKALRVALLSQKTFGLERIMKPHVIDHSLSEHDKNINFFFFKSAKFRSNHTLVLRHARGGKRERDHTKI